jgi:D-psicose/D-tagatose/L-ribulose 3-epimerase
MIELGAHAFVWIGAWDTESGNQTIRDAARAGVGFLEIPLLNPYKFDAASHRRVLQAEGLGATCSLGLPAHAHLPAHPHEATQFLEKALEQTAAVGADSLCGCIGYSLGTFTGVAPTAAERQAVLDVLGSLNEKARSMGVRLGLEAVNRYETYLYNTLSDTAETVRQIPGMFLHADTYHMNIEEEGMYQPFLDTADVLGYIHMSESHRGLLGTGTVDWNQVFQALATIGYRGRLVLESFAAINPDLAASTCLWRPPRHNGAQLAQGGLALLRQKAQQYGLTS